MPTGYTADVQSGKVTEFSEFAMQCARAFGALITMRDDPSGTPIPDEFKPSDYNEKRLEEVRADLANLRAMTIDQQVVELQREHVESLGYWVRRNKDRDEQKERYAAMIDKAESWTPPTPDHTEMKAFMLQQLRDSIDFDCRHSDSERPVLARRSEWFDAKIAALERDITYHAKAHAEEVERCRWRTEWIKALRASLVSHDKA